MLFFDQLKKSDHTLRTLAWCAFAGMAMLLIGLWYVQVVSFRQHAENQKAQSYRTVRIPAIRGKILDTAGQPLAENRPSYNINLYLDELRPLFKAEWKRCAPKTKLSKAALNILQAQARYRVVSNVVHHLATVMQQPVFLDASRFMNHYTNQLALPLPIMTNLTPTQVARFQEQPSTLPGLDLDIQPTRTYPRGQSGAHLVGFLRRDDSSMKDEDAFFNFRLPDYKGQIGIEGAFDQVLRGRAGVKSVLVNNLGYRQSETIWAQADPGKNVVLTLDLNLQAAAEKALMSLPDVRGAVVIMDPNNGDILSLVSVPSYDPNLFIPRINRMHWDALMNEDLKPTRSRATQENYAPGSIFKIVTALACLEAGLDPNAKIYNPGHIAVRGRRKPMNDTAPEGEYNFRRAFILSSNTYFITNGLKAGIERIVAIGHRLHLGERNQLPTWQDNGGIFPSLRRVRTGWVEGETANICIGQGEIAVTPLQMAIMTSAVANGGKVFWPRLVARIEPQDILSGESPTGYPQGRVRDHLGVSARSLQILREAMLADVEDKEGGGRFAAVPGFRICGKTGTAQVMDEQNRVIDLTTWFASYAPFENPRYVVIVMVESGKSGGLTCAPIAQKIYQAIQQYENHSNLRMTMK